MCTHIAKSLQTRSALALEPPAPMLDWTKILHYNFLEEFVLLHETHQDIHNRCWAEPVMHEYCHVETHFTQVILEANNANDPLCGALEEFCWRWWCINAHVLACLQDLYSLAGFTGSTTLGVRKGTPDYVQITVDLQALVTSEHQNAEADERDDCGGLEEDDAIAGEVSGLLNYISELP
ncbi:hypothetical protein BDR04DRAFT_1130932 [Suillus decipiens]|nr:hypothetical protein BDR04DRAFT_1130932 [Suillus decipiens]